MKIRIKKKHILLQALDSEGSISLKEIAKLLYDGHGELEQLKVIRLLAAYRMHDKRFENIRVRNKRVVVISS
ncbi:MAG: hypothetical protein A4E56_01893 [Pelotomaculum sp. PtaU1.Bin065]|nr:MAG: hypothetical protein A4E56_01893 [Pelotomaculum sp. PtaU1.Bin065]